MQRDLEYNLTDLRPVLPEFSAESVRDVMHELWIAREVERCGPSAWRRCAGTANHPPADPSALRVGRVKPEDLFDHDAFDGWFKQPPTTDGPAS